MTTSDDSLFKALEAIRGDAGIVRALSLYNLQHESDFREIGGELVLEFVREAANPAWDAGRLAEADRIVREEEPAVYGMGFHNMVVNLNGYGLDLGEEFPSAAARQLVLNVVSQHPWLSAQVLALEPRFPF
ncbi:hypothetical protein [Arthrobacter sp. IK3]|uniref:hypothetical protein n=1 Tax=Arthrobacter sp. IK3 TaxID=3448169 RepID=UPI003EE3999A